MNSLFSNLYPDYNDMIYNISIMIFSKIKKVKLCVRGYEHIAMPKAKTKNIKYPKGWCSKHLDTINSISISNDVNDCPFR